MALVECGSLRAGDTYSASLAANSIAVFDFFGTGDRLSGYRDFMTAGTDKGTADFLPSWAGNQQR